MPGRRARTSSSSAAASPGSPPRSTPPRAGLRVVVVTKDAADAGSTRWAQGGVAVVVGDVPGRQRRRARRRHPHRGCRAVRRRRGRLDPDRRPGRGGPAAGPRRRVRRDPDRRRWSAPARAGTRRSGWSGPGGDATGAEVERALVAAARGAGLPLLTGHVAVDALRDGRRQRVAGVTVLDDAGRPGVLRAPAVLLATGGYGQLFASTTNPATSTGDGVALALRAGATAADLEFVQFHPTVPARARRRAGTGRWSPRRSAARAACCATAPAPGSWSACTRWPSSPRATSSPRRSPGGWRETGAECVWLDATARRRLRRPLPDGDRRPAGPPGSTRRANRSR